MERINVAQRALFIGATPYRSSWLDMKALDFPAFTQTYRVMSSMPVDTPHRCIQKLRHLYVLCEHATRMDLFPYFQSRFRRLCCDMPVWEGQGHILPVLYLALCAVSINLKWTLPDVEISLHEAENPQDLAWSGYLCSLLASFWPDSRLEQSAKDIAYRLLQEPVCEQNAIGNYLLFSAVNDGDFQQKGAFKAMLQRREQEWQALRSRHQLGHGLDSFERLMLFYAASK